MVFARDPDSIVVVAYWFGPPWIEGAKNALLMRLRNFPHGSRIHVASGFNVVTDRKDSSWAAEWPEITLHRLPLVSSPAPTKLSPFINGIALLFWSALHMLLLRCRGTSLLYCYDVHAVFPALLSMLADRTVVELVTA